MRGGTLTARERLPTPPLEIVMLSWAITFLVIAIIAAVSASAAVRASRLPQIGSHKRKVRGGSWESLPHTYKGVAARACS